MCLLEMHINLSNESPFAGSRHRDLRGEGQKRWPRPTAPWGQPWSPANKHTTILSRTPAVTSSEALSPSWSSEVFTGPPPFGRPGSRSRGRRPACAPPVFARASNAEQDLSKPAPPRKWVRRGPGSESRGARGPRGPFTRPVSASRPAPARAAHKRRARHFSPRGPDTKRPRGSPPHLQHWAPRAFQNHRTPLRRARHSPGLPVPPGAAAAAAISCRSPSPRSRCQVTPFTWARSRPRLTAPRPDPSRPRLRRLRSALLARSPRSARGDGAQRLGESHRRRAAAPRPVACSPRGRMKAVL